MQDGAAILMHAGQDFAAIMRCAPRRYVRLDQHGWLGLTGEDCADLNSAVVVRGATPELLEEYVHEIRLRELPAVLMVDPSARDLSKAASAMGLTPAGATPVMLRHAAPIEPLHRTFNARRAGSMDVPTTNDLAAEAFSLERAAVHRATPAAYLDGLVETWLVEDAGVPVGCGTFVRTGDTVGVYIMSTPARHQRRGIGRAVLEHAMRHYQDDGVTTFTLEATAAGFHLYEQLGFRTVMEAPVFVIGESTQFPT